MGLEKMGLPPKPFEKGKDWTPDSLNCEGCQEPFSWINRKHHCRRCGGLYCNNCTLGRVYLRGQGDAAARVCDACKQIEEAAKFERYAKSKGPRGGSKVSGGKDDGTEALLKQVLKPDGKSSQGGELDIESILASVTDNDSDDHELGSPSREVASPVSPTKLHEQAQEEKKRYSALKKQGKDAEALKAFKRAKELERQAEARQKEIRHQRRVSTGSVVGHRSKTSPSKEDPGSPDTGTSRRKGEPCENQKKRRSLSQDQASEKGAASEKDDFRQELKALGWSDKEIREADKKPAAKTEDQLLAELAAEARPKSGRAATSAAAPGPNDAMSTQIMAHKRQALAFKREGRLAEAKDELRKAKILEKQAEEMALLGEAEGGDEGSDDDDLQALIRGLEREEKSKGNAGRGGTSQFIPEDFTFVGDDDDAHVDVDENDLDDPEMVAALRAMGWEEEASGLERTSKSQSKVTKPTPAPGPSLKEQILARKRKALALKREGKIAGARAEYGAAKELEQQLENLGSAISTKTPEIAPVRVLEPAFDVSASDKIEESEEKVEVTDEDMRDPEMMAALRAMGFGDDESPPSDEAVAPVKKPNPIEEASLKQEILGIKRQALALKREGRIDEARDALRRAKILEQQLEDLQAVSQPQEATPALIRESREIRRGAQRLPALSGALHFDDEGEEEDVEVDNADLVDPDIAAALADMGWQEDPADKSTDLAVAVPRNDGPSPQAAVISESAPANLRSVDERQTQIVEPKEAEVQKVAIKEPERTPGASANSTPSPATADHVISTKTKSQLQQELLGRKRRALALKREGKSEEARIELQEAKIIEQQLADLEKGPVMSLRTVADSKPVAAVQTAQPPSQQGFGHLLKREPEPSRPVYLDDEPVNEVEVTEDDMHDPALLRDLAGMGWQGDKEVAGPSKSSPVSEKTSRTGDKEPLSGSANSLGTQAQTGKDGEKEKNFLEFDWGDPLWHVKKTCKDTKGVNKEQVVKSPQKDEDENAFEGEYGEIGQTLDLIPPLSGSKDSAAPSQHRNPWNIFDRFHPSESKEENLSNKDSQSMKLAPFPHVTPKPPERPPPSAPSAKNAVVSITNATPATPSLQQDILALKRKALALKREGKLEDAREELRKAKLLEKQVVQQGAQAIASSTSTATAPGMGNSASSHAKIEEVSSTSRPVAPSRPEPPVAVKTSPQTAKGPGHKEEMQKQVRQTKDRMKLQQESLAHKRKAMGLRREGKVDEADAEYELAKALEKQMEDLDPMHGKEDVGDVAGVDDILDPQLLAALKGVGFGEGDLAGASTTLKGPVKPSTAQPRSNVGSTSGTSLGALEAEKKQLEERIRAQKLQAVQLKRAGKQGEALDKLRGAKQLEKRLLALTS